ncbi:Fe-S oxidoreductase [Sporosarcina sp. ACRSL]|uniref:CC/Se motif family (seleno)protein n=1 Tax=Sporosarcina sp. ACRSL TaxID=2918215 RepID=UPI001EF71EA5|nr:CC/Se motif family (seleno)protein [Sporosarcina sp. ACRSL]MCG7344201.1 Fe-S oxidoreductase [Sporosarcina sp. ACRSL]
MHIELDANAKSWLQSKGEQVSIKTIQVNACCAPPIQDLMTRLGKQKDLHNYVEIKVDNLSIYVEKHLSLNEKITLKLTGFGIFKTITAKTMTAKF